MICRHTVADWARYVRFPEEAEIFAACGLLVKEGVEVKDWWNIACLFWGRQSECPFYTPMGQEAPPESLSPEEVRLRLRAALPGPSPPPSPLRGEGVPQEKAVEVAVNLEEARRGLVEAMSWRRSLVIWTTNRRLGTGDWRLKPLSRLWSLVSSLWSWRKR